ncbi:putative glycosyl transferase group 1 [Nitrosotalea devaniterrae]|uniref:Putative glycosyl transferase group 1 n=2 Tax=cellular organisms TaxID=131567 RepID=A0A128A4I4_9ARCH|nr:putative glycosyl transferase group 1 [Candidatus Nitrosotalea devanaterra]
MKKVLIINWDCYPNFATGGVYTWTKTLIDSMPDYEFAVINQLSNPNSNGVYTIPKNVTNVIEVPIFGATRYEEFCKRDGKLQKRILKTTRHVIQEKFIPLYRQFMACVLSDRCNTQILADVIIQLHDFLITYDAKKCLEHPLTWDIFIEQLNKEPIYSNMTFKESLTAFQLIQRNIQLFSIQVPKVDVIHCSLAWLPSLVAVYAKKESNCPVIITEHGVAFRELLLYYNAYLFDEPSKIFWKVFSHNIVRVVYSIADVITPVCEANKNWEKSLGADPAKIKVIYNGVNTSRFKPMQVQRENSRPTVVTVARVDVFKDIVCLIQAIKYAKEMIPDIQCLIYGTSSDLDYSLRCIKTVKELQLEDHVKFMGGTKEPEKVYNAADIVAISSITEGFPFTIIEAMACGKAVIASDVGGVREALDGCGLLVRSRRPHELAQGMVKLLQDENLRHQLEAAAIKKVHDEFTLEKCVENFKKEYENLTRTHSSQESSREVIVQ